MTSENTTGNTVIIFHRTRQNVEESQANQREFLENYCRNFPPPLEIIDHMSGTERTERRIVDHARSDSKNPIIIVINSHLSKLENDTTYDMYTLLNSMKIMDKAELYLMDHKGRLYKEVTDIKDVKGSFMK